MSNSVTMKRNDTRPFLDVILQDVDGNALDLSPSTSTVSGVTFTMQDLDTSTVKVNAQDCTILDNVPGMVRYS